MKRKLNLSELTETQRTKKLDTLYVDTIIILEIGKIKFKKWKAEYEKYISLQTTYNYSNLDLEVALLNADVHFGIAEALEYQEIKERLKEMSGARSLKKIDE